MKKKVVSMITVIVMTFGMCSMIPMGSVKAAEEITVDDSILLEDAEESTGEMQQETRGQYLQTGSSKIVKSGTGKITAGGTTIAQKTVPTIKVTVTVERLVNGSWETYTSWVVSKSNTYTVSTSKTLTVPRGYYYRVASIHNASSDRGYSNTNALYVS